MSLSTKPEGAFTSEGAVSRNRCPAYKRPFDLVVLFLAHLLVLPLWAILWVVIPLLVWLEDRGPVFYRQKRSGKDGQVFTVLKFRTMVPDAKERGPAWTVEDDPRTSASTVQDRNIGLPAAL